MLKRQTVGYGEQVKITFVLPADTPHRPISVVGDFNEWNPTATPWQQHARGAYSASVVVDTGHCYLFRYLSKAGGWFNEGLADGIVAHETGVYDSILIT